MTHMVVVCACVCGKKEMEGMNSWLMLHISTGV